MSKGCFLIGCGPSLNKIDVPFLANFDTITFNRAFIAWDAWEFTPNYYACLDPIGLGDNASEIKLLVETYPETTFFLNSIASKFGIPSSRNVVLVTMKIGRIFSTDLNCLTDFGNVGASSLQILAILGYNKVVMVGVDGAYTFNDDASPVKGDPSFVIVGNDVDHFSPKYNVGKRRISQPNLENLLGKWPIVAQECKKRGMSVVNASPRTMLKCFPVVSFETALGWIDEPEGVFQYEKD